MNEVQSKIDQLLDSRFVTELLALRCDEGRIAGHATGFYLNNADLESMRSLLDPAEQHDDVGQIGCYRALPVCPNSERKADGDPFSEYRGVTFTYWVYREVLPASSYREWLSESKVDESKKRAGFEALDAYESLAGRTTIVVDDLKPLAFAARSRYQASWDIGIRFLSRLAAKHPSARECLTVLMTTGTAAEKVRVLGALSDHLPKSFCLTLIRRGLNDRGKRVRQSAANVARCFLLLELVDELGRIAGAESDPETKWQFEHAVALIRDGYHVYKDAHGSEAFVVRISDGYPAELLYPGAGWCSVEDVKQRGPKAVAEEIRRRASRSDAKWRPFRWPAE